MPLKSFTCPLPETRFLHAGSRVYKFKIRYGHFSSQIQQKQLLEAIRVILGNLDDLHPFSTDHFTIFPYLSKWERVSKMRFKHENVHLVPYPYICTMYLELNSFQQNVPCGKSVWVLCIAFLKLYFCETVPSGSQPSFFNISGWAGASTCLWNTCFSSLGLTMSVDIELRTLCFCFPNECVFLNNDSNNGNNVFCKISKCCHLPSVLFYSFL
uniref:Uncharacterized protein n=1 Tax=Strigops habroptila TaxID=2489341 RepID=A0A672U1N7_STRHB